MKKILCFICAFLIIATPLTGCSGQANKNETTAQPGADTATEHVSSEAAESSIKTAGSAISSESLNHRTDSADAPVVYFSSDISAQGLVKLYEALSWTPTGKVAVKVSTGESNNSNYLRPELIKDLVQELDGTIVECMTAYGGNRSTPESHHQIAEEHGFTAIAPFDLMDEDGEIEIPFTGGNRLDKAYVGSHIDQYKNVLVLSHFKGHAMAGYGGALKNIAIGMSSVSGKILIHSGGERTEGSIMNADQDAFLEALAEASKAITGYVGNENMIYISVMNRLSVDCDCDANPAEPDMHDIGILASTDPVALDQACIDFVYSAPDSSSLTERIESKNGVHTLEHAEKIGLGSRQYQLRIIE